MEYLESGIVNDVRECIDEIGLNDAVFVGGTDDAEMSVIIQSKIVDAIRFVLLSADTVLLEPKSEEYTSNGALPVDFLRMCLITSTSWSIPVYRLIPGNSKEYASLKNTHTTGFTDNPKVALTFANKSKQLEFYPSLTNGATLYYVPEPSISNGKYSIPERLYRGVVYYAAGLTLSAYKDAHASNLMGQAMEMIGGK